MKLREQDRHFLWSLLAAIGVIFVWKGLWEGLYEIPYFGDPWVALFIGLVILTFSGLIFREFDPLGSIEKSANKVVRSVFNNNNRKEFHLKYHDKVKKKDVSIRGDSIKGIEKSTIVVKDVKKNKEYFIPIHRITEITQKGETYWRM